MFIFIQEADLFKGMNSRIINEIVNKLVEESYDEGALVIKEGAPAEHLYILQEGQIRLRVGEHGRLTHLISGVGEAFGWSSLVDRKTYTASAECLEKSTLLRIDKETLEEIFQKDPESGLLFYKRLAGIIGDRLVNSYKTLLSAYKAEGPPSYG